MLYKFFDTNCFHQDPHFVGWLRRNEILPPTPEKLEELYLEHDAFIQRGIEWDEEQKRLIQEFKDKKVELDEKYDRPDLSASPKDWIPGTKAADELAEAETSEVQVRDEIDEMQKVYLDEFHKVYEKDKAAGKDLNNLAIEELKRAHYFFEYMRTSQRLYNLEQAKNQK